MSWIDPLISFRTSALEFFGIKEKKAEEKTDKKIELETTDENELAQVEVEENEAEKKEYGFFDIAKAVAGVLIPPLGVAMSIADKTNAKDEIAKNATGHTARGEELLTKWKEVQGQQDGFLGAISNGVANFMDNIPFVGDAFSGSNEVSNKIDALLKSAEADGEISDSEAQEIEQLINEWKIGQENGADIAADLISGIAAFAIFTVAIGGAAFTGGASLLLIPAAFAAGAAIKTGLKAGDAAVAGREYTSENLKYDLITGGINGALAPITGGIGGAIGKTVATSGAKVVGKKIATELAQNTTKTVAKTTTEKIGEEAAKQGTSKVASAIGKYEKFIKGNQDLGKNIQGLEISGKRKVAAYTVNFATDGALSGAPDNAIRTMLTGVYDPQSGEMRDATFEDVIAAAGVGALGGAVLGPVIGGSFQGISRVGTKMLSRTISNQVLPDSINTKFQAGESGDCALLSMLDGMIASKNPELSNMVLKNIETDYSRNYIVTIKDTKVTVYKNELKAVANENADGAIISDTKGIQIFEIAYAKYKTELNNQEVLNLASSDEGLYQIQQAITKSGNDYEVAINGEKINVKSAEVSNGANEIEIYQKAYNKYQGDPLEGGFADVIAGEFGLNSIHIKADDITDETLTKLADAQDDTVLSFGAKVDSKGNIIGDSYDVTINGETLSVSSSQITKNADGTSTVAIAKTQEVSIKDILSVTKNADGENVYSFAGQNGILDVLEKDLDVAQIDSMTFIAKIDGKDVEIKAQNFVGGSIIDENGNVFYRISQNGKESVVSASDIKTSNIDKTIYSVKTGETETFNVDDSAILQSSGTNHYFTIKNIDAENKKVTVTNTVDTAQEIVYTFDEIKDLGISIDGGATRAISGIKNSARDITESSKFYGIRENIKNTVNSQTAKNMAGAATSKTISAIGGVYKVINGGLDEVPNVTNSNIIINGVNVFKSLTGGVETLIGSSKKFAKNIYKDAIAKRNRNSAGAATSNVPATNTKIDELNVKIQEIDAKIAEKNKLYDESGEIHYAREAQSLNAQKYTLQYELEKEIGAINVVKDVDVDDEVPNVTQNNIAIQIAKRAQKLTDSAETLIQKAKTVSKTAGQKNADNNGKGSAQDGAGQQNKGQEQGKGAHHDSVETETDSFINKKVLENLKNDFEDRMTHFKIGDKAVGAYGLGLARGAKVAGKTLLASDSAQNIINSAKRRIVTARKFFNDKIEVISKNDGNKPAQPIEAEPAPTPAPTPTPAPKSKVAGIVADEVISKTFADKVARLEAFGISQDDIKAIAALDDEGYNFSLSFIEELNKMGEDVDSVDEILECVEVLKNFNAEQRAQYDYLRSENLNELQSFMPLAQEPFTDEQIQAYMVLIKRGFDVESARSIAELGDVGVKNFDNLVKNYDVSVEDAVYIMEQSNSYNINPLNEDGQIACAMLLKKYPDIERYKLASIAGAIAKLGENKSDNSKNIQGGIEFFEGLIEKYNISIENAIYILDDFNIEPLSKEQINACAKLLRDYPNIEKYNAIEIARNNLNDEQAQVYLHLIKSGDIYHKTDIAKLEKNKRDFCVILIDNGMESSAALNLANTFDNENCNFWADMVTKQKINAADVNGIRVNLQSDEREIVEQLLDKKCSVTSAIDIAKTDKNNRDFCVNLIEEQNLNARDAITLTKAKLSFDELKFAIEMIKEGKIGVHEALEAISSKMTQAQQEVYVRLIKNGLRSYEAKSVVSANLTDTERIICADLIIDEKLDNFVAQLVAGEHLTKEQSVDCANLIKNEIGMTRAIEIAKQRSIYDDLVQNHKMNVDDAIEVATLDKPKRDTYLYLYKNEKFNSVTSWHIIGENLTKEQLEICVGLIKNQKIDIYQACAIAKADLTKMQKNTCANLVKNGMSDNRAIEKAANLTETQFETYAYLTINHKFDAYRAEQIARKDFTSEQVDIYLTLVKNNEIEEYDIIKIVEENFSKEKCFMCVDFIKNGLTAQNAIDIAKLNDAQRSIYDDLMKRPKFFVSYDAIYIATEDLTEAQRKTCVDLIENYKIGCYNAVKIAKENLTESQLKNCVDFMKSPVVSCPNAVEIAKFDEAQRSNLFNLMENTKIVLYEAIKIVKARLTKEQIDIYNGLRINSNFDIGTIVKIAKNSEGDYAQFEKHIENLVKESGLEEKILMRLISYGGDFCTNVIKLKNTLKEAVLNGDENAYGDIKKQLAEIKQSEDGKSYFGGFEISTLDEIAQIAREGKYFANVEKSNFDMFLFDILRSNQEANHIKNFCLGKLDISNLNTQEQVSLREATQKYNMQDLELALDEVISKTITPTALNDKQDGANLFIKVLNNADKRVENTIKNANFEQFKEGLPLSYSREAFIKDLRASANDEILKKLRITLTSDNKGYDGVLALDKLDLGNEKEKEVYDIVHKFIYENEVKTGDSALDETLNALIGGMPEWVNIIGKKQHGTHDYSVDVHILNVLKNALNNENYEKLRNVDKTKMKLAILMHDIAKSEGVEDSAHPQNSALYARNILEKYSLSQSIKDRIYELILNHHWLKDYNTATDEGTISRLAVRMRSYDDYSVSKIMAEADLRGANKISWNDYKDVLSQEKQGKMADLLSNIDKNGALLFTAKNVNLNKVPTVSYKDNTYKVINFNDITDDFDLSQYGFPTGTTKANAQFLIHTSNNVENLEIVSAISDVSKDSVLSSSLVSAKNPKTYGGNQFGVILNSENYNVASTYYKNTNSGTKKGFNQFANEFFSGGRSEFRAYYSNSMREKLGLDEGGYAKLYQQISSKKYISQIEDVTIGESISQIEDVTIGESISQIEDVTIGKKTITKERIEVCDIKEQIEDVTIGKKTITKERIEDIKEQIEDVTIGKKTITKERIEKAIKETQQAIEESKGATKEEAFNEIIVYNAKTEALFAKVNTMDEIPEEYLKYARKHNLPIYLFGKDA